MPSGARADSSVTPMAIPRFYLENGFAGGSLELSEAEAKHASQVLRMKAGDLLVAFDGKGNQATATIQSVAKKSVVARIDSLELLPGDLPKSTTLAVALPKGDRQRGVIERAVELGIHRFIPLLSKRSVAEPTDSAVARLERYVLEACKQCGRNRFMEIAPPSEFDSLIAQPDDSPSSIRWIAHPYLEELGDVKNVDLAQNTDEFLIAIGPEGGFTSEEVSGAREHGWRLLKMGNRILRVETAVAYAGALLGTILEPPRDV